MIFFEKSKKSDFFYLNWFFLSVYVSSVTDRKMGIWYGELHSMEIKQPWLLVILDQNVKLGATMKISSLIVALAEYSAIR
jgi:hypothetical protein